MSVWFTSDLHLGHANMAKLRGYDNCDEHDEFILSRLRFLKKRDKLFVLGDVAWKKEHLRLLNQINCYKELIFGNHDKLGWVEYAKVFQKLHGFRNYKDYWLSHCPVIPQEIRRKGNIHGHIHISNTRTTQPDDARYINVNIDMNDFHPVNFEDIGV